MRLDNVPAGVMGEVRGTFNIEGGEKIAFTNRHVGSGSTEFEFGTSNTGEFTVGAAIIGAVKFTLLNDSGLFDNVNWVNSTVDIVVNVSGTDVDMGRYYIVDHNEHGYTISIEAYDALKILDDYRIYETGLTWPSTAKTVLSAISSFHSFTITGIEDMEDIPIEDPGDDTLTERACVAYVAQMYGKFVVWRRGEMRLDWYDMKTQYDVGMAFSHGLRTDDVTVGGVRVETSDGKTYKELGEGYMLKIGDNPFIQPSNIDTVANNLSSACIGITYRPGSAVILSNPAIEAGDVLLVSTAKESGVLIIASTVRYKPTSVQQTVTSEAEEYEGDLRLKHAAYIKRKAQDNLNDNLNDPNSDLSRRLGGNVWPPSTIGLHQANISINIDYGSNTTTCAAIQPDGTPGVARINSLSISPVGVMSMPPALVGVRYDGYHGMPKDVIPIPCNISAQVILPSGKSSTLTCTAVLSFTPSSSVVWMDDPTSGKIMQLEMYGPSTDGGAQGIAIPFYDSSSRKTGFVMWFGWLRDPLEGKKWKIVLPEGKNYAIPAT